MPKLVPDGEFPGLYLDPTSLIYYLKKTVQKKGRIYLSLRTRDRKRATEIMEEVLFQWRISRESGPERQINEIVKELLERYYHTRSPATYQNFKIITLTHIMPYFDRVPIKNVARGISGYVAYQKKKNPTRKLKHDIKHLHRILHYSVEQGYIESFPRFKLDRRERTPTPGIEYTDEQIKTLSGALPVRHRDQMGIILSTGMRPGEVRNLKFEYIDFKNETITLPAEATKTRVERTFPVDKKALKRLAELKLQSSGAYVFPSKHNPDAPEVKSSKPWQRAETKVGFKVRPHWFRHTFATRALRAGVPAPLISKHLGMSEEILRRVYLHPSEEDAKRITDAAMINMPTLF